MSKDVFKSDVTIECYDGNMTLSVSDTDSDALLLQLWDNNLPGELGLVLNKNKCFELYKLFKNKYKFQE